MKDLTKKLFSMASLAVPFLLSGVATTAVAQTTRASCEADAKAQNIVGADRQMFMMACLPVGMSADEPSNVAKVSEAKPAASTAKSTSATKLASNKLSKKPSTTAKANKAKVKKAVTKKPNAAKPKAKKAKANRAKTKKNTANNLSKNVPAKVAVKPI